MPVHPPTEPWPSRLAAFADHELAVSGLAAATVASHRSYLRAYARWWEQARPGRDAATASTVDLADHLVAEARRGIGPGTRRAQAAALRHFYAWLVLTGATDADPTVGLALPRVPPLQPELYRPEEVVVVLDHLATLDDPRGRQRQAIVASLRYTGMRSGELRTLRRDQLDLDGARARVRSKGGHPRIVLLPAPLLAILRRFLTEVRPELGSSPLLLVNPHPYVTTPDGGFGQQTLHREVELAGLGAGVPGRHFPHKWRHTYATELVRRGVDIHVVQRLLGHASISSTLGYVHLALDDLRATVDAVFAPETPTWQ
jgi:site-specific recombinase XerD